MDDSHSREFAEFLRARRARLRPEDVGLEPGSRRKVTGLRREELALLAGVSTDYYQRMEQGRHLRPSDEVLDGLARALALTGDETRHLHTLARAVRRPSRPKGRGATPERVPETTRRLLHTLSGPAMVLGRHLDVLAWNRQAGVLFGGLDDLEDHERNVLSALFHHPDARELCPDWEASAIEYIGMLRASVAAEPDHPRARSLVGELSVRSQDFRRLWARHDVREKTSGVKTFRHPMVGRLTLDWDAYPLPGRPGPVLMAFTAAPESADAHRLRLLDGLLPAVRSVDDFPGRRPSSMAAEG
ncbi:transcriptional regulator with XRE-family HTH domain [Actinoalloteichus hoggarensis]|uniref:Helix-turn-helix protein n=1 Tax=Actinoalloteichus hoggarensis TaxID=1470176 RepID=A0A221W3W6_9PSEU|nr:helix-turn-helix transcriptional regulator [Actinoalloteichus hoggarensis]ASO20349.1 helix-turn-helix protein [Actinoalloteichus hoggarensis]MBB5923387.1 transcriptional regulator with XRE-family HTH domain [Actinoalloteichus hoggarensis]